MYLNFIPETQVQPHLNEELWPLDQLIEIAGISSAISLKLDIYLLL